MTPAPRTPDTQQPDCIRGTTSRLSQHIAGVAGRRRIGKAPGAAAPFALAARRAHRRVAARDRGTGVIAARPVVADCASRPAEMPAAARGSENQHGNAHDQCPHHARPSRCLGAARVPPASRRTPFRTKCHNNFARWRRVNHCRVADRSSTAGIRAQLSHAGSRSIARQSAMFADACLRRAAARFGSPTCRNAHSAAAGVVESASRSWNTTPAAIWRAGSKALWCRAARPPTAFSSPAGWPLDFWPVVILQAAAAVWVIGMLLRLASLQSLSVRIAGDRCGAGADHGAAVARERAADRYFRRPCGARLACAWSGTASGSRRGERLALDRFIAFRGFDP